MQKVDCIQYLGIEHTITLHKKELNYIQESRKEHVLPIHSENSGGDWMTFKIVIRRLKEINENPKRVYPGYE